MRTLSSRGLQLIASFEGFVPTPYNDAASPPNATIGYGHLLHPGPVTTADISRWGTISHAAGLELLRKDAAGFAANVDRVVKVRLGLIPVRAQARFDALCSFAFNIGTGGFDGSHALALVNERGAPRDWTPCATAMLAWTHAGGKVLPGLLRRRQIEGHVLITGQYPAFPV